MPKNHRKRLPGKAKREVKDDALELAQLIYDVFKENKASGKIDNGQNNAQTQGS